MRVLCKFDEIDMKILLWRETIIYSFPWKRFFIKRIWLLESDIEKVIHRGWSEESVGDMEIGD